MKLITNDGREIPLTRDGTGNWTGVHNGMTYFLSTVRTSIAVTPPKWRPAQ